MKTELTPAELKRAASNPKASKEAQNTLHFLADIIWSHRRIEISILSYIIPKPVLGEISRLLEMEGQIVEPTQMLPCYGLEIAPKIWIRTPDVSVEVRSKLIFEELAA